MVEHLKYSQKYLYMIHLKMLIRFFKSQTSKNIKIETYNLVYLNKELPIDI